MVAELSDWLQLMVAEIARRREEGLDAREERAQRKVETPVVESNRDAQQQQTDGDRQQCLKEARPA
jgi:hypothetical protein